MLDLRKYKMKGIRKITMVPGVFELNTKKQGKLYINKFFLFDGKNNDLPKMVALASKSSSMNKLYGVIFYNLKQNPVATFVLRPNYKPEDVARFIGEGVTSTKYKIKTKIRENVIQQRLEGKPIKEGFVEIIIDAAKQNPELLIIMLPSFLLVGLLFILPWIQRFFFLIESIKNWLTEKYIESKAEQELNEELFGNQKYDEPAFAMFNSLKEYIVHVAKKQANALIICGPPGMSKTYTVRRTLYFLGMKPRIEYIIEKGSSLGLESTYALLYKHRKKLLILDDFDTPLMNEDTVNLLKAITDSYGKRIISLPRDKQMASGGELARSKTPDKFEFEGQLIIITNLNKSQISPALLSRAPAYEVFYDTKQVIDALQKLLKFTHPKVPVSVKQEVYDYITMLYKYDNNINISFRSFASAVDARVGNPHAWKPMVKIIVGYKGKNIAESFIQDIQKYTV